MEFELFSLKDKMVLCWCLRKNRCAVLPCLKGFQSFKFSEECLPDNYCAIFNIKQYYLHLTKHEIPPNATIGRVLQLLSYAVGGGFTSLENLCKSFNIKNQMTL